MSNLIWADMEAYRGVGKGENDTESSFIPGPENKRECPCDTCPMMEQCATTGKECTAFRSWCNTGEYDITKIMKLLK